MEGSAERLAEGSQTRPDSWPASYMVGVIPLFVRYGKRKERHCQRGHRQCGKTLSCSKN